MREAPESVWLPLDLAVECQWKEGVAEVEYVRADCIAELRTRAEDAEMLAERRKWGAEEMDRLRAELAEAREKQRLDQRQCKAQCR